MEILLENSGRQYNLCFMFHITLIQVSDRECSKNLNCRPIYYGYQGQNLEQNIKINNIIRGKLVICCDESHTPEIQGYYTLQTLASNLFMICRIKYLIRFGILNTKEMFYKVSVKSCHKILYEVYRKQFFLHLINNAAGKTAVCTRKK